MQYVLFTDNLADLQIEQVCKEAKRAGFDGIDLTLRPGGHVLPERVEMGLSAARTIADRHEAIRPLASTTITDSDSPHAEDVIASCAHCGVKKIKLGYRRYEPFTHRFGRYHVASSSFSGQRTFTRLRSPIV